MNSVETALAPLRREYIATALDGLIFQAEGAIRFLDRGDDASAEQTLARLFHFARDAAGEMKILRGHRPIETAKPAQVAQVSEDVKPYQDGTVSDAVPA